MSAFPEFPSVDEMDVAALPWAATNRTYDTDALKDMLARHFRLSPELLDRRRGDGTLAFSNRVDWLTARWTMRGVHVGSKKHYRLTEEGHEEARRRGEPPLTPQPEPRIGPRDADEDREPLDGADTRAIVLRQIRERRGQSTFRNALIAAYRGRCAMTGCRVLDVLEAAHIHPHLGEWTNTPSNGLLLRADLHTLLDCSLLAVEPDTLRVVVAPSIRAASDGKLHGRTLRPREPGSTTLDGGALSDRFEKFVRLHGARSIEA
jgi:hypothetical protein